MGAGREPETAQLRGEAAGTNGEERSGESERGGVKTYNRDSMLGALLERRSLVAFGGPMVAMLLGLCTTGAGCAHRIPLEAGTGGHGTNGRVTVVDRDYGTRVVKLRIEALVAPESTAPGARVYVAWAQCDGIATQNLGALRLLREGGELEAVVPSSRFRLVVTAEASEDAEAPSTQPLFSADVGR